MSEQELDEKEVKKSLEKWYFHLKEAHNHLKIISKDFEELYEALEHPPK